MIKSAARVPSHRNFRAAAQVSALFPPSKPTPLLVGVVANLATLNRAIRLRALPDFFELRLDALAHALKETERGIPSLRAPLIVTARHPAEGGVGELRTPQREKLLRRFLSHAAMIDVEIRSATALAEVMEEAKRAEVARLLSCHDFADTPTPTALRRQLDAAMELGADIFKIATRTDSVAQLDRLLEFVHENSGRFPIAAMGMGKLGRESRRQLLRLGSILNYGAVASGNVPGQPTLRELHRTRKAYIKEEPPLSDAK